MSADTPDYTDIRIKHLEMIQSVISRMSANSGTIKRYAVVITAAAVSFAKFAGSPMILGISVAVVIVFTLLDARYLRLERSYRDLYDTVQLESPDRRPDFRLDADQNGRSLIRVLSSWSVAGLYGALILFMFAVIPFLKTGTATIAE